jgi:cell division protein FtsN
MEETTPEPWDENISDSSENVSLWNTLLLLTIAVAIICAVLVVNKEEYFPSLYSSRHEAHVKARSPENKKEHKSLAEDSQVKHAAQGSESEPKHSAQNSASGGTSFSTNGRYLLIGGSFKSEGNADQLLNKVKSLWSDLQPSILQVNVSDTTYYRVVVSQSDSFSSLNSLKTTIQQSGFTDSWIVEK